MFQKIKMLKILLGIMLGISMLFMGAIFLETVIHFFVLGIIPNIFEILAVLAYLYFIIGLLRVKKWALIMASIIGIVCLIDVIFILSLTESKEILFESFIYLVPTVFIIIFPIFGILAVIRWLIKWHRKKDKKIL